MRNYWKFHRFEMLNRIHDGYSTDAIWDHEYFPPRLVFLLVVPSGQFSGAGSSAIADDEPGRWGVSRIPRGIFIDGVKVPGSDSGGVWIYLWHKNEAVRLDVDGTFITPEIFERLDETTIWRESILPALKRESENNEIHFLKGS
jgi:hypothetical protein